MSKKNSELCTLYVLNLKGVTRQIARQILGPNQGNTIKFYDLGQVGHALNLQKNHQIEIKTDIPTHVLMQLQPTIEPVVTPTSQPDRVVIVEAVEEAEVVVREEETNKDEPEWYLSWEQVENMSKPDLQKWAEKYKPEGLTLSKSKNATETKELVHAYLGNLFVIHVE